MSKTDLKTSAVSKTESLVLMKNMIRISVSSICYMRELFPDDCFKNKEYGSVGIHQLQAAKKNDSTGEISIINSEAFLLTQWLEKGVFLALESEYLSSVTFAIYTKHPLTKQDLLLETYEFKVSYQADSPPKLNDVAMVSRETVKNQAAKFIRSLTEFSGTLDTLPDERWITLQLKYQDNTPAEYEPEYFKAAQGSLLGIENLPLKINVGSLKTPCVDMKVKFAGMESLLFEDLCKVTVGSVPLGDKIVGGIFKGANFQEVHKEADGELVSGIDSMQVVEDTPLEEIHKYHSDQNELINCVKNYIVEGGVASIKACSDKLKLKEGDVKKAFSVLVKDGVIRQKKKGGRYEVPPESLKSFSGSAPESFDTLVHSVTPCATPRSKSFYAEMEDTAGSTAMEEDIETDLTGEVADDSHSVGSKQQLNRLTKSTLQIQSVKSGSSMQVGVVGKENVNNQQQALETSDTTSKNKRKAGEDNCVSLSLSQTSEMSDSGAGSKRQRKYSVIRDPIHLSHITESKVPRH